MVIRGCSVRVEGGVYACCGVPGERNIENFLLDPPHSVPEDLNIPARGVILFSNTGPEGTHHVIDRVGSNFYQNVADFVEEAARFGVSRRLELRPEQYAKLDSNSRLILIHERAIIENYDEFYKKTTYSCPTGKHIPSPDLEQMCVGLWYEDLEYGVVQEAIDTQRDTIIRNMPSFNYIGRTRPDGIEYKYLQGMFMMVPIQRLEIIKSKDNSHINSLKKASAAKLPVIVAEE